MAKSRPVLLAGTSFDVPMLPIRLNKIAFPICRKLHNEGFLDKIAAGNGQVDCTQSEMDDLIEIAYVAACAANPRITREEFDNWPVTPPELVDAYFAMRYQTGAWIAADASTEDTAGEGEDDLGEAKEVETLPT